MADDENYIYDLLKEMILKGLVSTGSTWIEKAVAQKNSRLSVGIASSIVLAYDQVDKKLLSLSHIN